MCLQGGKLPVALACRVVQCPSPIFFGGGSTIQSWGLHCSRMKIKPPGTQRPISDDHLSFTQAPHLPAHTGFCHSVSCPRTFAHDVLQPRQLSNFSFLSILPVTCPSPSILFTYHLHGQDSAPEQQSNPGLRWPDSRLDASHLSARWTSL